jgi:hypothetical protein
MHVLNRAVQLPRAAAPRILLRFLLATQTIISEHAALRVRSAAVLPQNLRQTVGIVVDVGRGRAAAHVLRLRQIARKVECVI